MSGLEVVCTCYIRSSTFHTIETDETKTLDEPKNNKKLEPQNFFNGY